MASSSFSTQLLDSVESCSQIYLNPQHTMAIYLPDLNNIPCLTEDFKLYLQENDISDPILYQFKSFSLRKKSFFNYEQWFTPYFKSEDQIKVFVKVPIDYRQNVIKIIIVREEQALSPKQYAFERKIKKEPVQNEQFSASERRKIIKKYINDKHVFNQLYFDESNTCAFAIYPLLNGDNSITFYYVNPQGKCLIFHSFDSELYIGKKLPTMYLYRQLNKDYRYQHFASEPKLAKNSKFLTIQIRFSHGSNILFTCSTDGNYISDSEDDE